MAVGSLLFRISLVGDPTSLILGTLIYLATSVSFGLFFGVRASNQNAAVQGTAVLGFLTAFLLSGFIYPLSNIPFPISLISNLIPARYYILLTRDVFVRGTGWQGIWYAPLAIGAIGLIFFTIAARALQRMQLPD
jgi:ABC-2 type transport system permease protein